MIDVNRFLHLAEMQMQRGNLDQAVEMLRQVLSFEPNHEDAHAMLALCLVSQKRLSAAEYEARAALASDANNLLGLYALATVTMYQRKYKESEALLETLLAMDPNDPENHRLKARLLKLQGKRKEQFQCLQNARAQDPESVQTLVDIGNYYLDGGDLDNAEAIAHEGLISQPEHQDCLILMGHIHLLRGRIEEARDHAIWALRQNPADDDSLRLLAAIKARTNFFLGLWWRYNAKMALLGETKAIVVLLGAFLLYRLFSIFMEQQGHPDLVGVVNLFWLGICIYTWVGPALFRRSVEKELRQVTLKEDF